MTTNDYVTVKEASELTGVSRWRIRQLVRGYRDIDEKHGTYTDYPPVVPSIRQGRLWLIKRDDLHLIEARRRPGWEKGRKRSSHGHGLSRLGCTCEDCFK